MNASERFSFFPRCCAGLLAALALWAGGCVSPPEPGSGALSDNVVDWRDEIIYQILVDRFANGDASNDVGVAVHDPSAFHGGDWRGIRDKLDYLEALGVTALWISPVVKNVESDAGFSSYHGYWAQDFERTNPHFGDATALRELVDAAHARGFKVILDIVTNHVGQAFYYDINKNGRPDEFFIGQGGEIIPIGQAESPSELTRISEWDPDFDRDGVQAWTSLGPSGLAPIEFVHQPAINRVPPQPELFAQPWAYNAKGRVTVWSHPAVCGCADWGCPWDDACRREQEILGDFPGGLKDLATERQDVRDALFRVYARWIDIGDFDGFRIDTLKHVEHDFWADFCPRIRAHAAERGKHNFLQFGEAFDGSDELLGAYTQGAGVDSVFYFSQYYTVFRGAMLGDGARTCEIERLHCRRLGCVADPCGEGAAIEALYSDAPEAQGPVGADGLGLNARQLVVNFLSNHDVGRFLFFMPDAWPHSEKRRLLLLGLTYLLTVDGIPCLYYGVEQEFAGGNDPANRETLWRQTEYTHAVWKDGRWQQANKTYDADGDGAADTVWRPFDTENPVFRFIQRLNRLRSEHVALRRGELVVRWSTSDSGGQDHGLFAFERVHPDERLLVLLNLDARHLPASPSDQAPAARSARDGALMPVGFAPGTRLVDLLHPDYAVTVGDSGCTAAAGQGCLDATVPAHAARILAPGS